MALCFFASRAASAARPFLGGTLLQCQRRPLNQSSHIYIYNAAQQAMKRLLDNPQPSSGEQYYREDVLLSPREFPLPEGERAWRVACSGALTAVVTGML